MLTVLVYAAIGLGMTYRGHGTWVMAAWVGPALLATAVLAFVFDWLPHQPDADRTRYGNSRILLFPGLGVLLTNQNLHLVVDLDLFPADRKNKTPSERRIHPKNVSLAYGNHLIVEHRDSCCFRNVPIAVRKCGERRCSHLNSIQSARAFVKQNLTIPVSRFSTGVFPVTDERRAAWKCTSIHLSGYKMGRSS